VLYVPSNTV